MAINIREFRNQMAQTLQQQRAMEKSISFKRILQATGGIQEETLEGMSKTSKMFADPILFHLLREQAYPKGSRSRVRKSQDKVITKKPQAKDVLPNRLLDEEDEKAIQEIESLEPNVYINPLVPKKRKYVAETKVPTVLCTTTTTTTSSSDNPPAPETTTPSTSSDTQPSTNQNDTMTRLLHPELALPQTLEFEDAEEANDVEEDDDDDDTSTRNGMDDEDRLGNNPNIPGTEITRRYREIMTILRNSPLQSVRQDSIMELLPRHRRTLNYVLPERHIKSYTSRAYQASYRRGKNASEEEDEDDDDDSENDSSQDEEEQGPQEELPLGGDTPEVILSIAVYHPRQPAVKIQEFTVLGSQKLSELRDVIKCLRDFTKSASRKDGDPNGKIINTERQKLSGSYMFFENVFYIDTRAEELGLGPEPDYSEPIRAWVMENERYSQPGLGQYTTKPMQHTTFEDLSIKLNHPYHFTHQKNCRHALVVRDIRLCSKKDDCPRYRYPLMTYSWRYARNKCTMCQVYPAEYMTVNDFMSGSSPCFFCRHCYGPFHFKKDGTQVFPFEMAEYLGHTR